MKKMESPNSKNVTVTLTEGIISTTAAIEGVQSDSCGAIVTFVGNVRAFDHDKEVSTLTYEIHPQTNETLVDVVKEVADRHEVTKVSVAHRYGEIPIGESAFIVAVSAPHRAEAFAACTELVDEVKARIPIWKHQVFADGSDEWVNCA
jgi:molybdopterin synthase catalytic subunit